MSHDPRQYGWNDPRHWRGGWLQIYANPNDPRLWVPKRRPGLGWTLNVSHPKAPLILGGVAVLLIAAAAARALV